MKLLLLGKDGQVGWELQRALSPLGRVIALGRRAADLDDLDTLRRCIREHRPDVVVNAAAYTAVDKAESEPQQAYRRNAEAVGALAEEVEELGALLVHYSTDYVFDGRKLGAYEEDDEPNPLNVYGSSKLQGERRIRDTKARHLIFRTSWVYAVRGVNFPRSILRLAREREELRVVADQSGAPTSAQLIADVSAIALYRCLRAPADGEGLFGTYHLTASGTTNWHAYAVELLSLAEARGMKFKAHADAVRPITAAEYPLAAKRPANSSLSNRKLSRVFGLELPDWRHHLARFVDEVSAIGEAS